jgi:hypothetical protein
MLTVKTCRAGTAACPACLDRLQVDLLVAEPGLIAAGAPEILQRLSRPPGRFPSDPFRITKHFGIFSVN